MADGPDPGSDLPDGLSEAHAGDRTTTPLLVRLLPTLFLGAIIAPAFTGLYGGTPNAVYRAAGDRAALTANVPRVLRSGEFFEMRFRLLATAPLANATLEIDETYLHEITVNTQMPAPEKEETSGGAYRFSYGPLEAGEALDIKFDGQVNPSLFLGTEGAATLSDGETEIARIPLKLTVLP